ncbi:MAG: thermonuclease family protein, partial [Prosthecobacter sp.]|nr:thermonuclease family protein [Prosthecobacter sp.]
MRRRRFANPFWVILILFAIGFQAWKEVYKEPPAASNGTPKATKQFAVLQGAFLHEDKNNDGDSFKILHLGQVHEFRLYFADCPEKRRHQYNGDRLRDQGRYFGGLTETQTVAIGQRAQEFAEELLTTQPFTMHTKWQAVFDSGRYYAFIIFSDGEDLSAKLVRAGLARIYTGGTTLPDGRQASFY